MAAAVAEAEMRALVIEQHALQVSVLRHAGEGGIERRYHLGVDDVRLGPVEPQPQQSTVVLDKPRGSKTEMRMSPDNPFAHSSSPTLVASTTRKTAP